MLRNTKRNRQEALTAGYWFDHPRGQRFQTEADDCCVWERGAEGAGEEKVEGGKERKKPMEAEKGESTGESSVVPMVQRMSCLYSHG